MRLAVGAIVAGSRLNQAVDPCAPSRTSVSMLGECCAQRATSGRRRDELAVVIRSLDVMGARVRDLVWLRWGRLRVLAAVSCVSQMSELRASMRAPRLRAGRRKARIDTGGRST